MDSKSSTKSFGKKILVVGSVGYDSVETPSGKVTGVLGGSANYFSMAASQYSEVNVVGVVGEDYNPSDLDILRRRKVCVDGLKVENGLTFRWSGSYLADLNEAVTLQTQLNVLKDFNPVIPESYKNSDLVFLANIDPVLQLKVLDQVKAPQYVGLDTMNYWIDSKIEDLKKILKRVDAFLLNEIEAIKLTGEKNIVLATKKLVEMGPQTVVVKRGEYGFFMLHRDQFFVLPAFPIDKVVDPTGAGDCFAGGFFGYLSRVENPKNLRSQQEACLHGSVIASYCIQDFSIRALESLDWTMVEKRLVEYLRIVTLANAQY